MSSPEMVFQVGPLYSERPMRWRELSFFFLLDGTFLLSEPEFIHSIENPTRGITIPEGIEHFFLNAEQGAMLLRLVQTNPGKDITLQVQDRPGVVWVLRGAMLKDFMESFHAETDADVVERLKR